MMIARHEGHGSLTKQFLKEGSMGSVKKVNHLHSHHAHSSVEILSPRSVLEQQRALSGLAIAIDLEEKMKLSPQTQENVMLGRFLSKQSIMQMSTQEAQGKENLTVGRYLSRERMILSRERLSLMKQEEREEFPGEESVGLKMVISMQQVSKQELDKAEDKLLMGRSLSIERMRGMMQKNDGKKERETLSEGSNGGILVGASLEEEREQDNACVSGKVVRSADEYHLLQSPLAAPSSSCRRGSCKCGQSTWWLHELGPVQQSFPPCASSMENSIFYYATASNPPPPSSAHHRWRGTLDYGSPVEDFLQCCYSCKCRLGAGKDIYMYRGDQAFCSVECRYEQIAKDECMGA